MGFIISNTARKSHHFEESLFQPEGNVKFSDFKAVQHFTAELKKINARVGEINAMSLIYEIFQYVIHIYIQQKNPHLWEKIIDKLFQKPGQVELYDAIHLFTTQFPPLMVFHKKNSAADYIKKNTKGIPNLYIQLEALLLLWITNTNPASSPYIKILFDDDILNKQSAYKKIISELKQFFKTQPLFGPMNQDLITMLQAPALAVPDSFSGQLAYIRENWRELLGDFLTRLLQGLDLLKEEERFRGIGPGKPEVYDFSRLDSEAEYEKFSIDLHWMPRLVLIAKSTYVWLDQLSKKHSRHISRLDQIPDEELNILAKSGFTGLWLIGLWERSRASQRIKQKCGNPEALASAYSIYEYRVANDLGGDEALKSLKERAWKRGIRLTSDMVPNHMGIDSPWLVEHPDWFLSLDYCPYPSYSFTGEDLSSDSRVSIFLEDHYYDRTDAAVVFKWVDNINGQVRYIYHGNDGTSMPWNDTAQLNYLNPETRAAITNTIFSVASQFPIIRFDAAMTLTKKHYQRLWYPEPGSGGDIPTRSWHGMESHEFHRLMPEEFWRQVVDRFAESQSDTLLLAEAFWLMEAYFVRTLGMHRVYNSAFMNFLKNEENDKYRASIKSILQFNPEILKRFVNFMNNPDEETAEAQFGKGDKYFGVCTLMITLPGLPMFGHGQIEGFTEKYGMEYRRAYKNESPDQYLIQRHQREIFPLLRKRYLFAEVEEFLFYDFFVPEGWINEDVFAYSNHYASEYSLVIYHNKFAETSGWIKTAVPFTSKNDTENILIQKTLAEGLGIKMDKNYFTIFRDFDSGLQFIRNNQELHEKGLYVELKAYKRNVFIDFQEIEDSIEGYYNQLTEMLNGQGVPDVNKSLRRHFYNPLLKPFRELFNFKLFQQLHTILLKSISKPANKEKEFDSISIQTILNELENKSILLYASVQSILNRTNVNPESLAKSIRNKVENAIRLLLQDHNDNFKIIYDYIHQTVTSTDFIWLYLLPVADMLGEDKVKQLWSFLYEWLLIDELMEFFTNSKISIEDATQSLGIIKIMLKWHFLKIEPPIEALNKWELLLKDSDVLKFLRVNTHEGISWFHKESGEELLTKIFYSFLLDLPEINEKLSSKDADRIQNHFHQIQKLQQTLHQSNYQLDQFRKLLAEKTQ